MRWEFNTLNAGFVTRSKPLRALLEAGESLRTRDGDPYDIDRRVLERLAAVCTPPERERLRLPITIHFTADVEDAAYVTDELAADVLHRLESWGEAYAYRDRKMWLPQSLAADILLRYGGALQRLLL
jgi:uncharacterized protein (UPF0216 family)